MTPAQLAKQIETCRLCADRFAQTATAHKPRPIVWFANGARILICGQAPGMRVHQSGLPFDDPSGDRLRNWMGIDRDTFYDKQKIAIIPMAFCFPGYDAKGSDLPPPKICAKTWHKDLFHALTQSKLTLLVGGYAHKFHLSAKTNVTETVANWRAFGADRIPLPHPSWRNTAWIKKNPWFEADVLPTLRARVAEALA